MQPIDKDAIAISQSWGSLASTAIALDRAVELPGTSTDWAAVTDHNPRAGSVYQSVCTGPTHFGTDAGPSQSSRLTERTVLFPYLPMASNTYGTNTQPNDLIDLESARKMNSNFSFPSNRRSGQYRLQLPPPPSDAPQSTDGSIGTDSAAVASSSDTSIGATLLRNLLTSRPSHPKHLKSTVFGIMLL